MGFGTILEENSLLFIFVSDWAPILITIFAGGFAASILFPRLQSASLRRTDLYKRKAEISEEVARQFPIYATSWHRLISISKLEEARELRDIERDRKKQFIEGRMTARDGLYSAFALCLLYFSDNVCHKIRDFQDWDDAQSDKRLTDLADPDRWRHWNKRIVEALRDEIGLH